jgi:hypothetical protein
MLYRLCIINYQWKPNCILNYKCVYLERFPSLTCAQCTYKKATFRKKELKNPIQMMNMAWNPSGICYLIINCWVMHPVARVLIKYWNNLRTQQSIFLVLDFIVHFSHYMFRPRLAAIFRWFANTKIYPRQSLYIQRIRWVGMYKVKIVVR